MWHLEKPSKKTLDDYATKLLPALKKKIEKSTKLSQAVKDILLPPLADGSKDDKRLRALLVSEPRRLFWLSEGLMKRILPSYNRTELNDLAKAVKAINKTPQQNNLISKYSILNDLKNAFDYNGILGGNKSRAYRLTAAAMHNTCVYCNRQYAFNIVRDGGKNDDNRIARPDLDHWFPKSLFPLMSLSYYNLIPSCSVCNSSAKTDEIWMFSTHIHPYLTKPDVPQFKFRYKKGINSNWDIDFDGLAGIEKNTVESLCLQEAYQAHSDLEVADLIELATKNNGTYMKQLYGTILGLYTGGLDKAQAYRLLLGTEMMSDAYKNRPMSKLKRDIIEQIEKVQKIKFFD